MPFVHLATEVGYLRRMREVLRTIMSSESNVVNFFLLLLTSSDQFILSNTGREMALQGVRLGL